MSQNTAHQKLMDEILFAIGSLPECRVWPRNVGYAVPLHGSHPVHYGIDGESDIDGIFAWGQRISVEVKTGKGVLNAKQIKWKNMILKFGGFYFEAHDLDSVLTAVKKEIASRNGGERSSDPGRK